MVLTIGIVWFSAYLGDTVSYLLGRRLGRDFILKHGPRLRITRERFAQVESYFDKHGGKTILIGRFIGLVRALAPFIAGSSGMRYRAMAPYSVLGTGLWATAFTLLGYFASKNIDAVLDNSERALFAFAVIVALVVGSDRPLPLAQGGGEPREGGDVDGGAAGLPQPARDGAAARARRRGSSGTG